MANPAGGLNRTVPARGAVEITPSDSGSFNPNYRALYIGQKGHVKVDTLGGQTVTFSNVQTGTWLPVEVTRVYATGTTASSIVGVY